MVLVATSASLAAPGRRCDGRFDDLLSLCRLRRERLLAKKAGLRRGAAEPNAARRLMLASNIADVEERKISCGNASPAAERSVTKAI